MKTLAFAISAALSLNLSALARSSTVPLGAAARPFPDTTAVTRVFADQLPSSLTEPQWRFVASHYAGSQKQTRSWARRIRALNPAYLLLHYQLAVGTGPAAFVTGDRWTNDFSAVSQHESWFLHDPAGHRLLQPAWNWYVMDLRFNGDRPATGFPDYWVRTAIDRMRANEDDGCFADSYTQDILMNQLRPPSRLFTSVDAIRREWLPQLNRFGAYCAAAFHRQPERFYYLPNLGGLVTTWDRTTDLGVGDGGMIEGFALSGTSSFYSLDDWKLQMDRILSLVHRNKILICQSYVHSLDFEGRAFALGSYLLTRGRRSYLNMFEKSSLEWYPEYDLTLGKPLESLTSAEAAAIPGLPIYRRRFQHGTVYVNPTDRPQTVPTSGPVTIVHFDSGGPISAAGKATARIHREPADSLNVPPHSARIVLTNERPTPD